MNDNFLKLLNPELDELQTKALKVDRNAVIAAGAGSGKTQVLATRFAWLIMTGQAKVDEILTLTFTNKAASEMYQRIYSTLSFFASQEESSLLTKDNKEKAQEALDNFSQAHIQTLDSYCGGILRQAANRYGIRPDFTTGSGDSSRDIKKKALAFTLSHAERKGVQTFSDTGKLQEFSEDILSYTIENYTSLATEENYFKNKLKLQRKEIVEAWGYYIKGDKDENFDFNSPVKPLKTYMEDLQNAFYASDKRNAKGKEAYCKAMEELFEKFSDQSGYWPYLTEEKLLNNLEETKKEINAVKDFITEIEKTSKVTGSIRDVNAFFKPITDKDTGAKNHYLSIIEYINQYDAIEDLNDLFDEFLLEVNKTKRTSGNLTFNDVTSMSLKILLENEDIRNQEKTSFKKIMIDEFQDNNGKNRDLLYLLSLKEGEFENEEGNYVIKCDENHSLSSLIVEKDTNGKIINDRRSPAKLFFVGDEKQSIYMFRGAEVSVFNELTKDDENKLISMTFNYRSSAPLIGSFNKLFKGGNGIFEKDDVKKDYEAYYTNDAMKNGIEVPPLSVENVPVHVRIVDSKDTSENKEALNLLPDKDQLAYYMAYLISEMGKEKKNWKDIAILDKSRTDRNIITKYLSMFNIPYELDQFSNIFEDGIVNDFYNFFRLCVYPSDSAAYSVYLTCPLSGLSINSLEIILSHLNKYSKDNRVSFTPFPEDSEVEKALSEELDEISFNKYLKAKNFYNENKNLTLQQCITTTLNTLWHKKGYKYETVLTQQAELCSEHFDMIFEMGRQADSEGKSVSWFVDQLGLLKDKYNSGLADIDAKGVTYPLERSEAVRIMTIHKSKGLQFHHVFVYGCTSPTYDKEYSKIFFDEENGVSIKPSSDIKNYFYIKGKELDRAKQLAEFRRLIYVAITRAEDDVYIVGSVNRTTKSDSPLRLIENTIEKFYPGDSGKEKVFNNESGFDFKLIEPIAYNTIPSFNLKTSIDILRKNLIHKYDDVVSNAKEIEYTVNSIPRNTPSGLEIFEEGEKSEDIDTGAKYEIESDTLVSSTFTATDFGTLVHAYLEAQCNGIEAENFEPRPSLFKSEKKEKIDELKKTCIDYCHAFRNSKLGRELEVAKVSQVFYRAEWGFRMWYMNSIFTGSIDLIYENPDGTYTIVDYKSDTNINPYLYIEQQHCYRAAASKLLDVDEDKIKLFLYYIKHDIIEELD